MIDPPPPVTPLPAEAGTLTNVTNISGGVSLDAQRDVNIGGDVVGRDKITSVNTGGGAHVEGDVQTAEFVGRDKTIIQTITNIFQGDTAQRDLRNRRNMLELVKNTWVKGVLEKSLYHEVMLDLGLEERPSEVQHPWDMTLQMPERENCVLPPDTKILQVFDDANHALLILGDPGSGKTTMLLELARETIARAEKDPTQPIPVVFNLSSWSADPKQSIADWLVQELHDKYDAHKRIAQPWIDNGDLLLLLDGLDEVKAEYRVACVKAINDFRSEHGQTQLTVCSRIVDYEVLATQLKLGGAILIQPLTAQQIDEYLEKAGDELATVRKTLRHDDDFQELTQSPLMLSIMNLAYSGQSADYLISVPGDKTQRRKHLFDAYVDKMFARTARTANKPYSKEDTARWLTRLADRMLEHGQTVFLIEQMQPSWLHSLSQRRIFSIGYGLACGLIFVLVMGLGLGLVGGLVLALVGGLGGGLLIWLVGGQGKIKPVESVQLSWPRLVGGLVGGLFLGLVGGLVLALVFRLFMGLFMGLFLGLIMGLFVGVNIGLRAKQIETNMKPNQGIWLSGRNALLVGSFAGLVLGLPIGLVFGLFTGLFFGLVFGLFTGLVMGLGVGLFGGLSIGLLFGGLAFIQHFMLRIILWRNGDIPGDYVRFLDYAADRIFLRKVGGGYIFIHRMLMEYFASLETQPGKTE